MIAFVSVLCLQIGGDWYWRPVTFPPEPATPRRQAMCNYVYVGVNIYVSSVLKMPAD